MVELNEAENALKSAYLNILAEELGRLDKKKKKPVSEKVICSGYGNIYRASITKRVGRNELCPCGSGKKYKKCCMEVFDENDS